MMRLRFAAEKLRVVLALVQIAAVASLALCATASPAQSSGLTVSGSLFAATVGKSYSAPLHVTGGVDPIVFTESGSLPDGMSWVASNAGVVLNGVPNSQGSYPLVVTARDAIGQVSSWNGTLIVANRLRPLDNQTKPTVYMDEVGLGIDVTTITIGLSIQPTTVPEGIVGAAYATTTFTSPGGGNAVDFTESGNLPQGLTATPGTNNLVLSGTPVQSGAFEFTINAADHAGHTGSQAYLLYIVTPPPLVVTPASIPGGAEVGYIYSTTQFGFTGGSGQATVALSSGAIPPGLTLTSIGQNAAAILFGSPTQAGTFTFTITATDANIAGSTASQTYTIVVLPLPAATIALSTTPNSPPLYTDAVTLNFAATGNYPSVPTGNIVATIDGTAAATLGVGNGSLTAPLVNGAASLKIGTLAPGTHTVIYTYSGDSVYPGTAGTGFYTFTVSYPLYYLTGTSVTVVPSVPGYTNTYYDAVDSSDNVYVSDYTNSVIRKYHTSGNMTVVPTTGLNHPAGMAFDGNGNLYIADTRNNRIVELTPGGTQSVLPMGTVTLSYPTALAIDPSSQNLWIVDANRRALEFNLPSQSVNTANTFSGLASPAASVAVALDGTVYVGTSGVSPACGALYKFAPGTTTATPSTYSQLCSLDSLAFDRSGNLFIQYSSSLFRLDAGGNLIQFAAANTSQIALDSQGTVWLANEDGSLDEFTPGPAGYAGVTPSSEGIHNGNGSVTFGGTFELYFHFPTSTSVSAIGWPTNSAYAFTSAGYDEPGFFFTDLYRAPLNPGLQKESFIAEFTDGTVLTVPLYGSAYNTELGISPGVVSAVSTNIGFTVTTFGGVALGKDYLDQRSFVYYSDTAANQVYYTDYAGDLNSSNTAYNSLGFTGLSAPTQVAVDGARAVYVLDSGGSRIVKLDSSGAQSVVFDLSKQSALSSLTAFALDGATNLYLAGTNSKGKAQIVKMLAQGGYTIFNANLAAVPTALAVDSNSLLTSGDATGAVIQFNRFGVANNIANVGAAITSMTIEPSGTIYATTTGSAVLSAVSPGGVVSSHTIAGVTSPLAVAEDNAGTLTVADGASGYLVTEVRDPYVLYNSGSPISGTIFNFPATGVGNSSPVQSFTATNIGTTQSYTVVNGGTTLAEAANSFLVLESLPNLADFPLASSTTCAAGVTNMSAGASCVLAYTFNPTALGKDSESSGMIYNTPHYNSSITQVVPTFTGTAITQYPAIAFSPTSLGFGKVGIGQSATATLTVYNNGGGTLHVSSIVSSDPQYTDSPSCATVAPLGTCTITVTFTAAVLGSDPAVLTFTDDTGGTVGSTQQISLSATGIAGTKPYIFVVNAAGSVSSLYSNGIVQSSAVAGGGIGAAVDRNGNVYSGKANETGVSNFFDTGGSSISTVFGTTGVAALAIDGNDQIWMAGSGVVKMAQLVGFSTPVNIAIPTLQSPSGVAIDISGNVWIADSQSNTVQEIVGGGAPVAPLANAVQTNTLGVKP